VLVLKIQLQRQVVQQLPRLPTLLLLLLVHPHPQQQQQQQRLLRCL
jgi:hypothetical protein